MRKAFEAVDFVVDVDDSFGAPSTALRLAIDQDSAGVLMASTSRRVYDTIGALIGGVQIGFSQRGAAASRSTSRSLLPSARLRSASACFRRRCRPAAPSARASRRARRRRAASGASAAPIPIFRHNGRFAEMVSAEVAGRFEAPIYGMLAVEDALDKIDWGARPKPDSRACTASRSTMRKPTLLWDGEWEVTYVTFRDMGAAFMVAILGIYLLVVAQFGSFKLPLVILMPVPLTLIGIVLGHWLLGAPFTATSMIGFIALAGIIVRNSILLVDFIRHARARGLPLRDALLEAGAIRFKPIFLTAAAAMIGAAFILDRPDLSGPGDLAGVRPRLLHRADAARHPGDLRLAARRPSLSKIDTRYLSSRVFM